MIIAGAGGLGLEIMSVLIDNGYTNEIFFYDKNPKKGGVLFNEFPVITDDESLQEVLIKNPNFIVGIGHPRLRERMYNKLLMLGGTPVNVVSKRASVFQYLEPFQGCFIEPGSGISHGTILGTGSAIHINSTIGHSVKLGKFANIGPGANIVGPCVIDDYAYISVGAIVLPNITVGKYAIVAANKVAHRDIADYELFEG